MDRKQQLRLMMRKAQTKASGSSSSSSASVAMKAALKEVRPSISAWFETARNYALFANASGEFNDLAEYIQQHKV